MFKKIRQLIKKSSLPFSDKNLWLKFVLMAGPENVRIILEAFNFGQAHLKFLTENLKQKVDLMRNVNLVEWQKIIEREKEYINNL